jgi:predicted transcriptional regulator
MAEEKELGTDETLHLATDIVAAFVSNNTMAPDKLPGLLQVVHDAVRALARGGTAHAGSQAPAVPIKKSVTPSAIICLEDGKPLKMLKRYLRTQYGLSPEDYRRKWGLPPDYPMTAPNYSKKRSEFAKKIGLGTPRAGTPRRKAARKASGRRKLAKAA